jgi:amidohydrolase
MLLGAAKILSQLKSEICGNVKFIFQPAEENGQGALKLLEAGVMDGVDAILGLHLWPDLPSGKVSLVPGPRMASADKLKITVRGKSSHGSMPHQGIDAILAAAAIIMNLQSVNSREIPPLEPSVITIGKLAGGTGWNITCDEVGLEGTTRCFSHEVRKNFPLVIERIIKNTAATFRAQADMEYIPIAPPLINDTGIAKLAAASLCKLYGDNILGDLEKVMGGEDFAYLCEKTPGTMAFVGIGNKAKNTDYPLHSDKFNIDEDVLPIGAALHAQFALDFLNQ